MEENSLETVITINDLIEELEPVEELIEDEALVSGLWHNLIEINKSVQDPPPDAQWEYAVKEWEAETKNVFPLREAKRKFFRYFKERFRIDLFLKCPVCGKGITRPRKNIYNQYFIGCSEYPKCRFVSTREDRDRIIKDLDKLNDSIIELVEGIMKDANALLVLAKRVQEHSCSYDEIRRIKQEWQRYERKYSEKRI